MPPLFQNVVGFAFELLWPSRCAGCDAFVSAEAGFCATCQVSLLALESACLRCAMPGTDAWSGATGCAHCQHRPWHLDATHSGAQYGGALVTALVRYKHGRQDLGPPLAQLLVAGLEAYCTPETIIVPVPLHPRRLRARGFNQALDLARLARGWLDPRKRPPLLPQALVRRRDSATPGEGRVAQRLARAEGAFGVAAPRAVEGRAVILVDDVLTTGATLNACALALAAAGARQVQAVTVARAV